jgi:predicted DNA-binding ribbon-helix-helix protein
VSKLHSEVLQQRGEPENFTSLLRCACLIHMDNRAAARSAPLAAE